MAKSEQTVEGAAFKHYCKRSGLKYVEIAKQLGLGHPQNITHWKKRGVPPRMAVRVATLLGCKPNEISRMEIDPGKADEYTGYAAKKREIRDAIWTVVDDIDDPKVLDLLVEQVRGIHKAFSR